MSVQLVWFKRDLRVHDHQALSEAAARGPVLPLYIVEPGYWSLHDTSLRQWAFIREALEALNAELNELGQGLIIRHGEARQVLRELHREHQLAAVWSHQETGNAWTYRRDQQLASWLRDLGIPWHECRQHGVARGAINRDRFSAQWEALMRVPQYQAPHLTPVSGVPSEPLRDKPIPTMAEDPCPGRQRFTAGSALETLDDFLSIRGVRYTKEMSSPLTAEGACSRISAHLAYGTLSMRQAVRATRERRAQVKAMPQVERGTWPKSLAGFEGRLHWHCHFIQKLESEPDLENREMLSPTQGLRGHHAQRYRAWQAGETGWPLVDACMRFLNHGGWLNFRMRAMLTSIASYHLWMDWRQPSHYLARLFVDYEPGIHYPQIQMQSGTTGINTLRIYNPIKQSKDQDPNGHFIRHWLPELTAIPDEWLHTPWLMPAAIQNKAGVLIGEHYPQPLVNHEQAAHEARQRMTQARRQDKAYEERRAIYEKHGSRKRPARKRLAKEHSSRPIQGSLL